MKKKNENRIATIAFYLLFGLFHECAHLIAAWSMDVWRPNEKEWLFFTLFKAALGRACEIPIPQNDAFAVWVVGHAGWIASLMIALLMHCACRMTMKRTRALSCARTAAWITLAEALCTDLFGIGTTEDFFYCGNFGIILTNSEAWVDFDGGRTALDLLERMVHITMMRGAQSGGVVAWTSNRRKKIRGIRSRVVNGKRTDLSKGVRRAVEKDCTTFGKLRPGIRAFLGHTRFATSSKATLDGTHPHRWTPPKMCRVYRLDRKSVYSSLHPTPEKVRVENFVTHNGDFDFYTVNGTPYGLEVVQKWLVKATGAPMPASVDSAAIAGMIDLLRTAGCFALSARYALLLNCKSSRMDPEAAIPSYKEFEKMGSVFEKALATTCQKTKVSLNVLKKSQALRKVYCRTVLAVLETRFFVDNKTSTLAQLISHRSDEEMGHGSADKASLLELVKGTIDAFFDNDLFQATRIFMHNAKGSFGLMVTSSLDAHRQVCLAARGQPMCVAFYPNKGIVCYGSEQAAVKVGLDVEMPGGKDYMADSLSRTRRGSVRLGAATDCMRNQSIAEETCRLDLDDLGGEVMLLDWGRSTEEDRMIEDVDKTRHQLLRGSTVDIMVYRESKTLTSLLSKRVIPLEDNDLIQELPKTDSTDPVLDDIRDIPKVCRSIQESWQVAGLNRYTAWNLVRRIKQRLNARISGKIPSHCGAVDILLTGCEVSLWLAEQFATDMRKAFPTLNVQAASSNKLLGVFGQELSMPASGYPMSEKSMDLKHSVVIIVSHSGQTFAPLACSSLLQSFTRDIFLVSSEWDTQIGKQLRAMWKDDDDIFSSRIFTTEVGVRPAEPCSVSVAATHQLLTQIFMHVSIALLSDDDLRHFSGAVVTRTDLQELARCNQDCIRALENIVGTSTDGRRPKAGTVTENQLRQQGDVWSEHVLEYPKAYAITLIYIIGTVTTGYAPITSISGALGLGSLGIDWIFYIMRFLDSLLYFFFLQLTIFVLRLFQGRNMRHRTVGRTVVIGDIPWVAQSADAFLSKLFACSYPIAGLNVLSGNPADHLVHRHTHRVVRGTLLVCGRPDGRLAALTNAEVSVCLSINQSSSIQSIGGSCETVTIGHNPSKLALSSNDIALGDHRPQYLCERVVGDMDITEERKKAEKRASVRASLRASIASSGSLGLDESTGSMRNGRYYEVKSKGGSSRSGTSTMSSLDDSTGSARRAGRYYVVKSNGAKGLGLDDSIGSSGRGRLEKRRSTHAIKGLYISLMQIAEGKESPSETLEQKVVENMIKERQGLDILRHLFNEMDKYETGRISVDEFVQSYVGINDGLSTEQVHQVIVEAGVGQNGTLSFDDFVRISKMPAVEILRSLQLAPRDAQGYLHVHPSREDYFGEKLQNSAESSVGSFAMSQSQHFSMELYEARIASLERFVAMCVMFHQMGSRVERFFHKWSLGILGYRVDRTHSILRIATTASPVSGSDIRERMEALELRGKIQNSLRVISAAWSRYEKAQVKHMKRQLSSRSLSEGVNILDRSNGSVASSISAGSGHGFEMQHENLTPLDRSNGSAGSRGSVGSGYGHARQTGPSDRSGGSTASTPSVGSGYGYRRQKPIIAVEE